ncbi:HEAT repeat domain-containing protein [Flavivirga spongiicola]|uniref:HEAT repeat domain-containing protein n=1 Tax=Flavivirga spongiicola TaxID=421621 RepID=A0ABU7XT92_9FLAO|nr:HEAT repeat domain-containing protein [Flavivirga sp. MEBiC05379]MDO5978722.1 HEAT repeat domain-containing protein [Flavivirga sp. MEBiC05379]
MGFYDLNKGARVLLVEKINQKIAFNLTSNKTESIIKYFSDEDTYIRKTGYLAIGKIFYSKPELQKTILSALKDLLKSDSEKVRQTVVNAAGEIGKFHFDKVKTFLILDCLTNTILLEMR